MLNWVNFTRIGGSTDADPSGRLVGTIGAVLGTLMSYKIFQDWYKLFQKCVRNAGITPNDLEDNEDNGYQLYQAVFGTAWKTVGNDGGATTFQNGANASAGPYAGGKSLRYRKTRGGSYVHLEGWYSSADNAGDTVTVLPVGFRPDQSARFSIVANDGGVSDASFTASGSLLSDGLTSSWYINIELPLP